MIVAQHGPEMPQCPRRDINAQLWNVALQKCRDILAAPYVAVRIRSSQERPRQTAASAQRTGNTVRARILPIDQKTPL